MLLFRPGELTRRYVAGERARFVSPLALFLFSVFTMFAVVSLLGSPMDMMEGEDRTELSSELQRELAEMDSRLETLRGEHAAAVARGADTAKIEKEMQDLESAQEIVSGLTGVSEPQATIGKSNPAISDPASSSTVSFQKDPNSPTTKLKVGSNAALGFQPESAFDKAYKAGKRNPKLLAYKLQTNAYKFSWALIVISVPFMALLFLWRWRPLYDHAVFVTYSITAVSILVILGSLLALAGSPPGPLVIAALLFIPWHMYRQLRGAYDLRRRSALWRTLALVVFANLALSLFATGLLMMGVLG
jgi:hypothetical protein